MIVSISQKAKAILALDTEIETVLNPQIERLRAELAAAWAKKEALEQAIVTLASKIND